MAAPASSIDVVNELVAVHARSLPAYLANATPWTRYADAEAIEVLEAIVADQRSMIDRLGDLIVRRGGNVDSVVFPMDFTDLNDLSVRFLLARLVACQQRDIVAIERAIERLGDDAEAKGIAEEALGAARAHLQSLEELASVNAAKQQPALG